MEEKRKKKTLMCCNSEKCITFAPLFRRNLWQEDVLPRYVARNYYKF